jgi:hypothetical protein
MRFALGLIFGIVLTVGTAYVTDAMHSAPGPDQKEAPRMVNWGVVNDNLRDLSSSVQDGWNRLTGHTRPT